MSDKSAPAKIGVGIKLAKLPVWAHWPSASSLVSLLGDKGPRLPLGFGPIDKGWRGGLPLGKRVSVLGAPSAGKTTWCVQMAVTLARSGALVVYIAGDEGRESILTRIGQQFGHDREALEKGFDSAKMGLARELETLPLVILDPDNDPDVTITNAAAYMVATRGDRPAVLFVDSLQTMAAAIPSGATPNPKANVDAILGEVKRAARADKISVFVLCEMNRGSYRAQSGPQATNDMAAGKESGGIEYGVDAQFVLRAPEKGTKAVKVTVPKSRMGKIEEFSMEQDYRFATFAVVAEAEPDNDTADVGATFRELVEQTFSAILESPRSSKTVIAMKLGKRKGDVGGAVDELVRTKRVIATGSGAHSGFEAARPREPLPLPVPATSSPL